MILDALAELALAELALAELALAELALAELGPLTRFSFPLPIVGDRDRPSAGLAAR